MVTAADSSSGSAGRFCTVINSPTVLQLLRTVHFSRPLRTLPWVSTCSAAPVSIYGCMLQLLDTVGAILGDAMAASSRLTLPLRRSKHGRRAQAKTEGRWQLLQIMTCDNPAQGSREALYSTGSGLPTPSSYQGSQTTAKYHRDPAHCSCSDLSGTRSVCISPKRSRLEFICIRIPICLKH